jgi:uncharacterized membrane protein YhaH (DUF805 family)
VASYRRPADVFRRRFSQSESEPRVLAYLMGAAAVMFIAQFPAVARRVWYTDPERFTTVPGAYQEAVNPEIGGALLGTLIFLPLIFYTVAGLVTLVSKLAGRAQRGYDVRLTLFWSLLAASPLALLNGLVAGFIGPGTALSLVGLVWLCVYLWFSTTGLRVAREDLA